MAFIILSLSWRQGNRCREKWSNSLKQELSMCGNSNLILVSFDCRPVVFLILFISHPFLPQRIWWFPPINSTVLLWGEKVGDFPWGPIRISVWDDMCGLEKMPETILVPHHLLWLTFSALSHIASWRFDFSPLTLELLSDFLFNNSVESVPSSHKFTRHGIFLSWNISGLAYFLLPETNLGLCGTRNSYDAVRLRFY